MDVGTIAALTLVAFAAGTIDAIAGGGGLLTLPALLAAGLPAHVALGTNKGQSVFGSLSATWSFFRAGKLDTARAPWSFAAGLTGSLAGAALVLLISPETLKPLILVLLIGAAAVVAFRRTPQTQTDPSLTRPVAHRAWPIAIALVIGAYDGFFGPGTGTFLILAYITLLKDSLPQATANAKVVNFASNLAAVSLFAARGTVLWSVALPMAAGQLAGGFLGARLAIRGGDRVIRATVLLVVFALALKIAVDLLG